jgi:hypothetical protein
MLLLVGIGKILLLLAEAVARHGGRRWVRLDTWSVHALRYSQRVSGALFQRQVRRLEEIPEHWQAGRLPDRV